MVQPQANRILEPKSLSDNQVTKHVGNLSFFKCPICPKSDMPYKRLVYHCKKEHKMKQLLYNKDHVVEARYHKCFICAKIVLCDNAILTAHVWRSHEIPLSSYVKKFVEKGGGKAFETFRDYCHNNQSFKKSSSS